MADSDSRIELSPGIVRFIERMGIYYERLGVSRIGGRILGLLMMARRPLTLDDMASLLHVSRASISTNARMNVATGTVRHVSLPGDRRDYYEFSPLAWEYRLALARPSTIELHDIAQEGLVALASTNHEGRERLIETIEFCNFLEAETDDLVARWRQHLARLRETHEVQKPADPQSLDTSFDASSVATPDTALDFAIGEAEYDGHD